MEPFSWKRWSDAEREKWREDLRDRDIWLNGHHKVAEYRGFSVNMGNSGVYWILGVGPMASFTRAISEIISEKIKLQRESMIIIVRVDLKPTPTAEEAQGKGITSIKYQLTLAVAKELGLLDQRFRILEEENVELNHAALRENVPLDQSYNSLKEKHEELQYYTYGCDGAAGILEAYVRLLLCHLVGKQLSAKNYMLVVNNLQWPIERGSLTQDCGLLLRRWTDSGWFITPTSQDAYNESKSEDDTVICFEKDEEVVLSTIFALHQLAEYMRLNMIHQEILEYWHVIAINCFHYAMAIFSKHSQGVAVTSDELIHQWATLLLLPRMAINSEEASANSSKCSYMRLVGRVILEAFQKYSLLQLPFSPPSVADEATSTAAQFFAYHGLIAECTTVDALADNKKKWISFSGDHGWHVSRGWLSGLEEESRGTTALILRGCSQVILSKLNHLLPKLFFLRVLDLSYTPLKSLPYSIGCLHNLRLLSLRGCHDLKILSSSSITSSTYSTQNTSSPLSTLYQLEMLDLNRVPLSHLTQDLANQKGNLIHLDISYSEITTFPPNFFRDMSSLEELILVNCSNLVELPPSMVALSSLTALEITGTELRYFPDKIFEEMQKLQSLKLVDNKKLISLTRPISRVHEFKLEGHPNLKSFSLIGSPHIQLLSLCGCRNLMSVEFMNLDALEEVDLSSTSIMDFPADIINCTHLRKLLLLGVPSLLRFPWHMLERLPEVFYLDQCPEGNGNHSDRVPQLCVSDPKFFYSFAKSCVDLVRDGRLFQSFYVRVAPCSANNRRLQHEEEMVDNKLRELVQKHSTYTDVYSSCYTEKISILSPIIAPLRRTERHVEITGMQQPTIGLYSLISVTKSISVRCDNSIKKFSDCSDFHDLEECELRCCHKMQIVFDHRQHLENLRNVHVYNLKSLRTFWAPYIAISSSSLVHLHLEYCPRLEYMMIHAVPLPCLKTIDILFCYSLKEIFFNTHLEYNMCQLPSLQRMRLQELPHLHHIADESASITAPMWKELHVRGCWSLRHLPCLQDQPQAMKVNGERRWWNKLQWGSSLHRDSYEPKLSPTFASLNERAGVTSYLR